MASSQGFDIIPSGAKGKAEPFQLHVADTDLSDFKTLLKLSPIAPETWENKTSTRDGGKYFGITRDWLVNAKETWLDKFDWRQQEAYINSFPNFKIPIKDGDNEPLSIHFAALFSKRKDATPVIFMHGWPGSFLEFLPMLALLKTKYTPETLPFHAIVPSLPGYTLSSGPPTGQDFAAADAARILNQLMIDLGFGGGYIAQGGDVGYILARQMSVAHDECKAFHVNFLPADGIVDQNDTEGVDEEELQQLEKVKLWRQTGMAYAMEHATRPATIGLALSSSPLALLAWIGEKHLEWSDTEGFPLDKILSMVTLYWFTSSLPRCIWPYRALFAGGSASAPISKTKPLGYSAFKDLGIVPKAWSKYFPNMKFRKTHEKGGHFAALEQPEAFLEDMEEFVVKVVGPLS